MIELRECDKKGTVTSKLVLKMFYTSKEAEQYMKDNYEFDEINGMLYHFLANCEVVAITYPELNLQLRRLLNDSSTDTI